jgi:hypothetical protein
MAWRLARSLVVLRNETRELFPGTTVWDIGDPAHQASDSDHNPNECCDVVCATDTLPNAGLNLAWFAERVREAGIGGHPAPKYVIYNRRIASRTRNWIWRPYGGSNPHTGHVHVSVGVGPDGRSTGPYDNTSPWGLLEDEDMALSESDLDKVEQRARLAVQQVVWQTRLASPSLGVPLPGQPLDWWIKKIGNILALNTSLSGQVAGLTALIEQLLNRPQVPITPEQFQQLLVAVTEAASEGAETALEDARFVVPDSE